MNEDEARKYIYRAIKKLPDQSKGVILIKNGQSITVESNDNKVEFYAALTPGLGLGQAFFSNKITFDKDCADKKYVLKTFLNTLSNRLAGQIVTLTEI